MGATRAFALALALLCCAPALQVEPALATLPPHVAQGAETDVCAMCHRAHTSASDVTAADNNGTRKNVFLVGTISADGGSTQLCYACHGVDTLGSSHNVEGEFRSGPGHSMIPTVSAYGPKNKECSDCHDAHGAAKRADGSPYPALLRSRDSNGTLRYTGDAYCGACHTPRAGNGFPGMAVWNQTAHARIATPTTGTDIVCDSCHTPHGSPIAPNMVSALSPPAVASTVTVSANDRQLCETCHPSARQTWQGSAIYETSAHGSSATTVAIAGEWAPAGANRRVGECQNCHAPMGASDGNGGAIPRMARKPGSALCYTCHDANGPATRDLKSRAYRPGRVVSALVGYWSDSTTPGFGALDVYTRNSTSSPTISGPRRYVRAKVGALAAGDVLGMNSSQLLVARSGTSRVTVFTPSPFSGLVADPGDRTLLAPAKYMAIADVLDDVYNRAELITADGDTVRVYRWDTVAASFVNITAITLPGTISGLAAGKILGGPHADIAVTTNGPDRLVVLTQQTESSLSIAGSYPTRSLPTGPSIGELNDDGHGEIAVANAGEMSPTLSVYSSDGAEIMTAGSASEASATATAIGDILPGVTEPGTNGNEVALAVGSVAGDEKVEVYTRSGTGLSAPETHTFGARTFPNSLALGDVDGDGHAELLVGLGGLRSGVQSEATPPGLAIMNASSDGKTLGGTALYTAGGVEQAGQTSVLAADLGAIGPSRHPVEAADNVHSSDEVAPFAEHVACVDCHNVHVGTAVKTAAPALPGVELGARGVSVSSGAMPTPTSSIEYEYQLCFKCHADYSGSQVLSGVRPVDVEFDTSNASFHPVEGVAPPTNAVGQTLADGLSTSSRLNCSDCHGNSAGRGSAASGQANGPHSSPSAPLLVRPIDGVPADDQSLLCYKCHLYSVYGDGTNDGGATQSSGFVDGSAGLKLHEFHTARGRTCLACHVNHGTAGKPYGLRNDIGWSADGNGGACTNSCHLGASKYYHR